MRGLRATVRRTAATAGVLIVGLIVAGDAHAEDFVAMGDSYSSGTGTREYYEDCERSKFAYSWLIDGQIPGNLKMVACGGATTSGAKSQADDASLNSGTEYVTISIGGNDAGFSSVLLECGQPGWMSDCDGAIDGAQNTIQNVLPGRLNEVLDKIRTSSSNGTIVTLVGYPRIFNGEDCNAATFFDGGEMTRLNEMADLLADVMRTQARENGYAYADARGAYLGHAVCDDAEWLNGLSNPTGESFHPNKLGHQGYAGIVRSALLSAEQPNVARGPNGRIAFARDGDIWVVNSNGQNADNVTDEIANAAIDPAWSPDGTKLAFASGGTSTTNDVYVVDFVNGGSPQRLTTHAADDREPAWSPNGDYLAFRSSRDGNNEIYKMTATGGSQTRLTANADSEFAPDWSPDGAEIAYQRFGSQNDVWKMNSDGQGQTRLTTDGAHDGHPAWSPSGHQIAFHSNRGGGDFEVFTMTATGGSQTARTSNTEDDRDPTWSPNGAQIAFARGPDGDTEIYTMTSTGGSQTRRTTTTVGDSKPSWQGDKTDPQTSFTSGPSNPGKTNLATPTFGLSSNELGATFECQIDGGGWSPCGTPFTTQPLPDGPHTIAARATDASGNLDDSPATRAFTVDTTPAGIAINAAPGALTGDDTPEFEFSSNAEDLARFECSIDDAPFATCTSPFTAAPLGDGEHTFRVIAVDTGGTPSEPLSHTFTVDTTAPQTGFTSTPPTPGNVSMPSFEFSSSEDQSSFECRLDSTDEGGWEECSSPLTLGDNGDAEDTPLADGPHRLEVRATDQVDNTDGTPATFDFVIDTVAPGVQIDADPGASTPDTTPAFEFSSADTSATFECRVDSLDDADWGACTSPFTAAALQDGEHFFQVRAIDAAGNAGEPDRHDFVVDATVPETSLTGGPAHLARFNPDLGPNYEFESDDDFATFECRLDKTAPLPSEEVKDWVECDPDENLRETFGTRPDPPTNPNDPVPPVQPITLSENATYVFMVRAVDSVDNRDQTVEQRSFVYDSTPPSLTLAQHASPTNDSTPTFAFSSPDGHLDGYECRTNSGDWTACDETYTTAELADGQHTVEVRASDSARNTTTKSQTFTVDTVGPSLDVTEAPPALSNDNTPTFAFTAELDAQVACKLDGGAFATCGSPTTRTVLDGGHTFQIRATDAAGNTTFATREFEVDTAAPLVAITSGPAAGERVTTDSATFAFAAGEASSFECRVDSAGAEGAYGPCGSPHTTASLPNATHTFRVRATDAAGNVGPPASRTFVVDAARPGQETGMTLGKVKRNTKRGTAKLAVTTTGAGQLSLAGKGIKPVSKSTTGGTVSLKIKPGSKLASKLASRGRAKVKVTVSFEPDGGRKRTQALKVRLVRK